MDNLVSRVYKPDPAWCCEACVFGRGKHSSWCFPCPHCGQRLNLWEQEKQQFAGVQSPEQLYELLREAARDGSHRAGCIRTSHEEPPTCACGDPSGCGVDQCIGCDCQCHDA